MLLSGYDNTQLQFYSNFKRTAPFVVLLLSKEARSTPLLFRFQPSRLVRVIADTRQLLTLERSRCKSWPSTPGQALSIRPCLDRSRSLLLGTALAAGRSSPARKNPDIIRHDPTKIDKIRYNSIYFHNLGEIQSHFGLFYFDPFRSYFDESLIQMRYNSRLNDSIKSRPAPVGNITNKKGRQNQHRSAKNPRLASHRTGVIPHRKRTPFFECRRSSPPLPSAPYPR